jgi:multiple sugar transport system substrate-binding protein
MAECWGAWPHRKWFYLAITVLLTALFVVGCQIFSPNRGESDRVVLKLSGWGSSPAEQQILQQVLQEFRDTHPQLDVRFEVIADQYMDVLTTRLIGDAAADVFYLQALEAPFFMANHVLEPLDRYITPEFDLADFEPNLLEPFQYRGQLYGLPKDFSTLALFYNRSALAAAGLETPPTTWAELVDYARQLTIDTNQDGRPEQYGLGILPDLARLVYMMTAFGGEIVDANGYATFASDRSLQGLELLVNQYLHDRTAVQPLDVGTNSGTEMFGQGKVAMVLEGNWAIPYLADTFPELEYATAEVPQINDQPGTMAYPVAYVMNRQSTHKSEAWELIAYLTGKAGMQRWTSGGAALPTRRSVAEQLAYDRDPLRAPFIAGANYATIWQAGNYPTPVMHSFNNQFISVLLGEQPLQLAMERAQAAANQQIRAALE